MVAWISRIRLMVGFVRCYWELLDGMCPVLFGLLDVHMMLFVMCVDSV